MPDEYVQVGSGLRVHRDLLSPCPLCKENQKRIKELEDASANWMTASIRCAEESQRLQARLDAVAKVQRFNNVNESYVMLPAKDGLWVRYSDVLIALEQKDDL